MTNLLQLTSDKDYVTEDDLQHNAETLLKRLVVARNICNDEVAASLTKFSYMNKVGVQ